MALYKAMNLSHLFDIHKDIVNFTEVSIFRNTLHPVRHLSGEREVNPQAPRATCVSAHNNNCYYNCKSA